MTQIITETITEVCVDSWSGALSAQKAGAHRIELCQELGCGGLTPSFALLHRVLALSIEVVVLIRPRAGDFAYDGDELGLMVQDVEYAVRSGAAGIAVGALQVDGKIDGPGMQALIEAADGLPVCFHRAFDGVKEPLRALRELRDLGVSRVLTSGQARDVVAGLPLLKRMLREGPTGIEIMPGGGVRAENVAAVLRGSGARSIHFSARVPAPARMQHTNAECDLHDPAMQLRGQTDEQEIRQYLAAILGA